MVSVKETIPRGRGKLAQKPRGVQSKFTIKF